MDPGFQDELHGILGHQKLDLPRVFIGGRPIGGADEIRQLHETGELKKLIQGLPFDDPGVCDQCGGHRFVLCEQCNGSHKVYVEKSGAFRSRSSCKLDVSRGNNGLFSWKCVNCWYKSLNWVQI